MRALFNNGSKVNIISPKFLQKLGLNVSKTGVMVQKNDGSIPNTFGMLIAHFWIEDKAGKSIFFQKIFIVANTKFVIIPEMIFLRISNANVLFGQKTLT